MESFQAYLAGILNVFVRLREYAKGDAELSVFAAVLDELVQQVTSVMRGNLHVPKLKSSPGSVPSAAHAREIIRIIADLPSVDDDLEDSRRLAIAKILENMVVGITGSIYSEYPEVIPRDKAED
jgi:hypothetical protein